MIDRKKIRAFLVEMATITQERDEAMRLLEVMVTAYENGALAPANRVRAFLSRMKEAKK